MLSVQESYVENVMFEACTVDIDLQVTHMFHGVWDVIGTVPLANRVVVRDIAPDLHTIY